MVTEVTDRAEIIAMSGETGIACDVGHNRADYGSRARESDVGGPFWPVLTLSAKRAP